LNFLVGAQVGNLRAADAAVSHKFADAAVFPVRGDHDHMQVFDAGGHDRVNDALGRTHS